MSNGKRGWDLTSTHSLLGAAEWIRKSSGAIAVVIVRATDSAMAVDLGTAPSAARACVEQVLPEVTAAVNAERHRRKAIMEGKSREKGGTA